MTQPHNRTRRIFLSTAGLAVPLLLGFAVFTSRPGDAEAGPLRDWFHCHHGSCNQGPPPLEVGGSWFWVRSPEEEQRMVASIFSRYCIRCHGPDGRGVWDIPDVPDFTNAAWQATRSDAMFARRIIEGRGAVMPTFRGTLSLEEAWAMARYIRTFLPENQPARPELPMPKKKDETAPKK
jgi:hypothetical protein